MVSPLRQLGGGVIKGPMPTRPQTGGTLPYNQAGQSLPMQSAMPMQVQPQTGLSGFESALQAGTGAGATALEQGTQSALGTLGATNQAIQNQLGSGATTALNLLQQGAGVLGGDFSARASTVDPNTGQPLFQQAASGVGAFSPVGLDAQQRQAALSGTLGQEAFDQAMINNPAMQFLREQGEQSVINQASALGGLGGGNVQKELARFGQGLASQDLQRQIQNQQALSQQGLQAAGQQGQFLSQAGQQKGNLAAQNAQLQTQAALQSARNRLGAAQAQSGLFGQGAGIISSLAGQGAGLTGQLGGQGAGIQQQAGRDALNLFSSMGQQLGQGRLQTGRDIANQLAQTTTGLSGLQQGQTSGLSDIIGQGSANISNLLSGFGQLDANTQQQLASILANISTGGASQVGQAEANIGQAKGAGITGKSDAIKGTLTDIAQLIAMGGGFGSKPKGYSY